MDYYIVDVFCVEKYSGNQLAVVMLDEEIPEALMQKIALEFHFSETTFILKYKNNEEDWNVRIFTPHNEVPFAGHPTLGTAFIIMKELAVNKKGITLNLKAGKIPVTSDEGGGGILWMKQLNPEFSRIFDKNDIAGIINMSPGEIDDEYPIQEVSTGLSIIIIPIKKLSSVKKAVTDIHAFKSYFGELGRPLFIFCPETYDKNNQINCRMFADYFGIPEDPATGSANGCLAGYLVKYGYFNKSEIDIRVEQGYEIGRPSLLRLKAKKESDETIDVKVGGRVALIAKGTLL